MSGKTKTTKTKPRRAKAPRQNGKRQPTPPPNMPVMEANAAGIDVGAREMFVAIPPDRDPQPVRVFATFIRDLEALADWSWTALCPDNDKTGGQVVWTGVRQVQNRVGQLFRQAANSLHHSQSHMGAHLRRMKPNWAAKPVS
jgi:hypothetical protein